MALTIGPAVSGAERRRLIAIHAVGLVLGAQTLVLGLMVAGAATGLLPDISPAIVAAGATVGAVGWGLRFLVGRGLPYPRRRWQVPEEWRRTLPSRVAIGLYGYVLGLGILTDPVSPVFWVFVVAVAFVGSAPVAIAGGLLYALVRAAMTHQAARGIARTESSPSEDDLNFRHGFVLARLGAVAVVIAVLAMSTPHLAS
jgi:hypothetical protein